MFGFATRPREHRKALVRRKGWAGTTPERDVRTTRVTSELRDLVKPARKAGAENDNRYWLNSPHRELTRTGQLYGKMTTGDRGPARSTWRYREILRK